MRGNDKHTHCRLCLGEKGKLLHVFESCRIEGFTAADVIVELLSFQVSAGDIYPQCVCIECLTKLEDFKLFKQQCVRNRELLDRASARKHKDGTNEDVMKCVMPNGVGYEVSIGEEGTGIHNEKDALDLDEGEIKIKTEPDDSVNYSSAEVTDSVVHEVFVSVKFEDDEVPCEDDFNNSIKEEVVDIPPESDSEEDKPGFSGGIETSTAINNTGITKLKNTYSYISDNVEVAKSPVPQSDNNGPERTPRTSRLTNEDDFNEYNPTSSNLELKVTKSGRKIYLCSECDKEFPSESKLRNHSTVHTGDRPFSCNQCEKSFSRKDILKAHLLSHSGEKQFVCSLCDKAYSSGWNLKNHMIIHSSEKNFKCNLCHKAFSHNGDLKKHMFVHSGEKPHECELCEKRFSHVSNLNAHMVIHTGARPYKCTLCSKTYPLKGTLKTHMLTHSTVKSYKCNICTKAFTLRNTLKMHMVSHSGVKNFICLECKKEFVRKENLMRHMIIHTGQKPFHCDVCQKGFSERRSLRKHELKHSRDSVFECTQCKRGFERSGDLEEHVRTRHSGIRPFGCVQCGKTFSRKCDLSNHIKTHS